MWGSKFLRLRHPDRSLGFGDHRSKGVGISLSYPCLHPRFYGDAFPSDDFMFCDEDDCLISFGHTGSVDCLSIEEGDRFML